MRAETPQIDARGARELYYQAVELARIYCPDSEWEDAQEKSAGEDLGLVLLRLFSKLGETVIRQVNRVPEKHHLAFYDFIGIDHLPSAPARAPLTFTLAEGTEDAVIIPGRTRVASSEDPAVEFETAAPLTAVNLEIKSAYSVNPWGDAYTDHGSDINGSKEGFHIFGRDKKEQPLEHALYLGDDAFDFEAPSDVTIKFSFKNYTEAFEGYLSSCSDGAGNGLDPETSSQEAGFQFKFRGVLVQKAVVGGAEGRWISFRPGSALPLGESSPLPEIEGILCDIETDGVLPDALFFNDTPADVKKGFYPFGETPKRGDAFYIGCDRALSKENATVDITFDVQGGKASDDLKLTWEYWDGSSWAAFMVAADETVDLTNTGEKKRVSFTCPPVETADINGIRSRWLRVRIDTGGYGEAGYYKQVRPIDEIIKAVSIPKTEIDTTLADARTEIIAELEKDIDIRGVPTERIDVIFRPFKANPGTLKKSIEGLISAHLEAVKTELVKEGITSGYTYVSPSFDPPFITSLSLGYTYTDKQIQECKTYNNFEYQDVDLKSSFKPFSLLEDAPAFYLGFDKNPGNKPYTLYFSFKGEAFGEEEEKIEDPDYEGGYLFLERAGEMVWEYYNGLDWVKFGVEDETEFFSTNGIVGLIFPPDMERRTEFNESLYWIRVKLQGGRWFNPPVLKGLFPNTVYAENAVVIEDELLGSSTGQPDQVFTFSSSPVMEGQVIEVREAGLPAQDEVAREAVRTVENASGDIEEVWVRWEEVKTFAHSSPRSRHYVLDRVNGEVIFGNGANGMIPPEMPNNILAREYKCGGGTKGNQKENLITSIKTTIPGVEGVTNPDPASGGRDLENLEDVLDRAPYTIKTRDRAVTGEDFERLAVESSTEVAKARSVTESSGMIRVIIAPDYENGSLYPDTGLIDYVEDYLKARAFFAVRDRIEVIGPRFRKINVDVKIVPVSSGEGGLVVARVKEKITAYLHPLRGGQEGEGWEFGQDIFLSEIAALIEDEEGVDYIKELTISKDSDASAGVGSDTRIEIEENALPCAGDITLSLASGED